MNDALKSIAGKYQINEDQLPTILGALNIKSERPSENQIKCVERVCELMQGGSPIEAAAATVVQEAKGKKTSKDSSALAQTDSSDLAAIAAEAVPPDIKSQLDAVAAAVGPVAVPDFVDLVTEEAISVENGIRAYSRQALVTAMSENPRPQGTPEEAVALFHKKQAERAAQRGH